MLPFEVSLALRYLRPKRTSISFITLISVVGVMLGVAVLIIVTSVFSGFHLQLKETFFKFSADLHVSKTAVSKGFPNALMPIDNYEEVAGKLDKIPGIKGTMPIITGKVMLQTEPKDGTQPVFDAPDFIGVDAERMKKVSEVPLRMVKGEFDLRGRGIVVGENFAQPTGRFRLKVGDTVLIYSPQDLKEMKDAQEQGDTVGILPKEFVVRGVFNAKHFKLNNHIFCSIYDAQDLYDLDDVAHTVWAETEDPLNLDPLKRAIYSELGPEFHVNTWESIDPTLLRQVGVEKNVTQFLMLFIVIVAAFGIASSLIIFGVQKTKEIGLLKALGATNRQVSVVFLIQSAVVGIMGTAFGLGLGMLVLKYRNNILGFFSDRDMELFPKELYGFDQLPAQVVMSDVVWICAASGIICLLAGILPAINAARLQPVEALRNE
tara:strand:- start:314 stop:1612 length:1299 start_codon:yes stop_codon:yes gene_type:complete